MNKLYRLLAGLSLIIASIELGARITEHIKESK